MFKLVEKKRKRKEEEEELGLDDEMKEALGLQDTDSDESDSDSEEDSEKEEAEPGDEDEGADEDEDEDEEEEDEEDEKPPIPVHSALLDPLYIISLDPQVIKLCLVCPGKILKGKDMFEVHKNSKAHIRRFEKFSKTAADADPKSNAWIIVDKMSEKGVPQPSLASAEGISKRAQKRKARSATIKERHAKRKAAAKAKKDAESKVDASTVTPGPGSETSKTKPQLAKKRKVTFNAEVSGEPAVKFSPKKLVSPSQPGRVTNSPIVSSKTTSRVKRGGKRNKLTKRVSVQ